MNKNIEGAMIELMTFCGVGIGFVYDKETKHLRIDVADDSGETARVKRLEVRTVQGIVLDINTEEV